MRQLSILTGSRTARSRQTLSRAGSSELHCTAEGLLGVRDTQAVIDIPDRLEARQYAATPQVNSWSPHMAAATSTSYPSNYHQFWRRPQSFGVLHEARR